MRGRKGVGHPQGDGVIGKDGGGAKGEAGKGRDECFQAFLLMFFLHLRRQPENQPRHEHEQDDDQNMGDEMRKDALEDL